MLRSFSLVLLAFLSFQSFGQNCAQLSVYFGSNKSRLKNNAKFQIDSLISSLDTSETYLIEISGFADSLGAFEYNSKLARNRTSHISSHIKSLRNNGIILKQFAYGETFRQQKEDYKNRRVEIFYTKIHQDSTVEIKGEQGEKVYLPYWFFWSSICNVNPQLEFKSTENSQMEFSMTFDHLDSTVHTGYKCVPITIRLPRLIFLANENLDMSDSIFYFGRCHDPTYVGDNFDSLSKEDPQFTVSYDSLNKEYVITHPCVRIEALFGGSCCGTKPCDSKGFKIFGLNQFDYVSYDVTHSEELIVSSDSVCCNTSIYDVKYHARQNIKLNILADYRGDIYEGNVPLDSLGIYKIFFTETYDEIKPSIDSLRGNCIGIYYVGIPNLTKIKRSKRLIRIKVPRRSEIDSIGFKLKPSGYFISMNKVEPRCYEHLHIKSRYDIAVYHHNTMTILKKSKIKKVKKRGYLKVRKKDLK
jgi:hypothetical protein